MIEHSTEYQLSRDAGLTWGVYLLGVWTDNAWFMAKSRETAGTGKTISVASLPLGYYYARLRITSLVNGLPTADSTVVLSNLFEFSVSNTNNFLYQTSAPQTEALGGVLLFTGSNSQAQGGTIHEIAGQTIYTSTLATTQAAQTQAIAESTSLTTLSGELMQTIGGEVYSYI